jgi:hypothetical protein
MIKGVLAGDYDLDAAIAAFIADAKALKPGQPCGFKDPVGNFKVARAAARQAYAEAIAAANAEMTAVAEGLTAVTMEIVQYREDLARARGKAAGKLEKMLRGRPARNTKDDIAAMRVIVKENPLADESYCRGLFETALRTKNPGLSKSWRQRLSRAAWFGAQRHPKK